MLQGSGLGEFTYTFPKLRIIHFRRFSATQILHASFLSRQVGLAGAGRLGHQFQAWEAGKTEGAHG